MAPAATRTPAERIRELSEINTDVAAMLQSAGHAVNALTNRSLQPADSEDTQMADEADNTIDAHKQAFMEHTEAYFTGVQGVFARLRRQAYALEEVGIIPPDSGIAGGALARPAAQSNGNQASAGRPDPERIKNGGLGNFDVGWLNSRGNKVGEEKEAELIQEAKALLEEALSQQEQAG